jgi:hypothetical protein
MGTCVLFSTDVCVSGGEVLGEGRRPPPSSNKNCAGTPAFPLAPLARKPRAQHSDRRRRPESDGLMPERPAGGGRGTAAAGALGREERNRRPLQSIQGLSKGYPREQFRSKAPVDAEQPGANCISAQGMGIVDRCGVGRGWQSVAGVSQKSRDCDEWSVICRKGQHME